MDTPRRLDEADRETIRGYAERVGVGVAAEEAGVASGTLCRAVGGFRVQYGTALLLGDLAADIRRRRS